MYIFSIYRKYYSSFHTILCLIKFIILHSVLKNNTFDYFLFKKIKTEKNEKVIALIIVVIQDLEKMKYGLKEDPNTGDISGDINKAREKIIK